MNTFSWWRHNRDNVPCTYTLTGNLSVTYDVIDQMLPVTSLVTKTFLSFVSGNLRGWYLLPIRVNHSKSSFHGLSYQVQYIKRISLAHWSRWHDQIFMHFNNSSKWTFMLGESCSNPLDFFTSEFYLFCRPNLFILIFESCICCICYL